MNVTPVSGPIFIFGAADEALDWFCFGFAHACELGEFDDEVACEFFRGGFVLHVGDRQAVREPGVGHAVEDGGFSRALGANEGEYLVEFGSGAEGSPVGGDEGFSGYCAGVVGVVGAECVDK